MHCTRAGARYTDLQQVDVQQGGIPPRAKGPADVSTVLDEARFGPLQLVVLAFTFFTLVMDGFDIQAIALAAPALTAAWGIERSSLGPVLAAALLACTPAISFSSLPACSRSRSSTWSRFAATFPRLHEEYHSE